MTLDDSFAPVYVGGWQAAKVRDNKTNDNFHAMAWAGGDGEAQPRHE